MILMGIDPGNVTTAVAWCRGVRGSVAILRRTTRLKGNARLVYWRDWWASTLKEVRPTHVALEGYAFGTRGRQFVIGELGGIIRVALTDAGIKPIIIAPTTVKKFATNDGRAKKPIMLQAAQALGYKGKSHDEADARLLLEILRVRLNAAAMRRAPEHQRVMLTNLVVPPGE